jgi:hypothetical protein
MIAVGMGMGPPAISMGNRNYEHRMTGVERGNILASEEKGGDYPLEVRQKGYLKMKDDNSKNNNSKRNTNLRKTLC